MKHISFLFLLFVSLSLFSQKKVWVKFGDQAMLENDAYSAAKFYETALEGDTADFELIYKLAIALASYQNHEKALPLFLKLKNKVKPSEYPLIDYQIAGIYKQKKQYEKSIQFYKSYVATSSEKSSFEYLKAKNEINNYSKVLSLLKDTLDIKIAPIKGNINTGSAEFAAFLYNDSSLVFSSFRAKKVEENGVVLDSNYVSKLYWAEKSDSTWKQINELNNELFLNSSVANVSFTKNREEVYFSLCDSSKKCKIYFANSQNGKISNLIALPEVINNSQSNNTQPCIVETENKKYLLFVSNREGGKGGMDLWIAEFQNQWQAPKNLGKIINSVGNEVTPFFDVHKNELYFSSDWHYNLGGFDVFKSKGTFPSSWTEPENLALPFNSSYNDLYYHQKDSINGFLTSSREGSITEKDAVCCNDIFEFSLLVNKPVQTNKIDSLTNDSIYTQPNQTNFFRFPLTVYFHNDIPNPRSKDTLTNLNYETTYLNYLQLKSQYQELFSAPYSANEKQLAIAAVDSFFIHHAQKGYVDLQLFARQLKFELEKGNSVEVLLKGFASPLTNVNYNVNLSLRRISSIINYIQEYENGVFMPYINGTAQNQAKLIFSKNPNGEFKSKKGVSSNYYDTRNSIYNPNAALERRVEVLAKFMGK